MKSEPGRRFSVRLSACRSDLSSFGPFEAIHLDPSIYTAETLCKQDGFELV